MRDDIRSLDHINAIQLLPIAATVVAAGTGAKLTTILTSEDAIFKVMLTCYILWGLSVPFAFIVFTLYYHRLILHKLPSREVIVSAFLPLGPCGYSATILILLGRAAKQVLPFVGGRDGGGGGGVEEEQSGAAGLMALLADEVAGSVAHVGGVLIALVLWGFGLIWFFFAVVAIYRSRPLSFNMGWWGFTFPLGVYSYTTILIGEELDTDVFKILGTVSASPSSLLTTPSP